MEEREGGRKMHKMTMEKEEGRKGEGREEQGETNGNDKIMRWCGCREER